jgi:TatD DNase family protein
MNILSEYFPIPSPINCIVHCFTGTVRELKAYVDCGFYIGLTGYIMNLPIDHLEEILRIIPQNRLVIETDSPYMGFIGCRENEVKKKKAKYPNSPSALPIILRRITATTGYATSEEIATQTALNSFHFFHLPPPFASQLRKL